MSAPELRLELGAEQVGIQALAQAASNISRLVSAVSKGAVDQRVEWTVRVEPGSVVLPLQPQARPDQRDLLLDAVIEGLASLQTKALRPARFDDSALEHARGLARLASDSLPIRVRLHEHVVQLDDGLVKNVDWIKRRREPTLGSVEGLLEEVNVHGQPSFRIWERLSHSELRCTSSELGVEELREALGRRVEIRGLIERDRNGKRKAVEVVKLRIFPPSDELPSADDVRGILRAR